VKATRWKVAVGAALSVVACFALAEVTGLMLFLGSCGGDGGEPFYDPDSTLGHFCTSGWPDPLFASTFFGSLACAVGFGIAATIRRSWNLLMLGLGTWLALVLVPFLIVISLPD
jgi:hypothetical protein